MGGLFRCLAYQVNVLILEMKTSVARNQEERGFQRLYEDISDREKREEKSSLPL